MMHGRGKSDSAIVAVKPANKEAGLAAEQSATEPAAAEPVEPRAGTKGNAVQQRTCRTQSRAGVSQALGRIRQTAKQFTVWTRGRSRMRESCTYGSVRGASSNRGPYRDTRGCYRSSGYMRRRAFLALLGGAGAWPLAAQAQTTRLRRIGILLGVSPSDTEWLRRVAAFTEGLHLLGWTEGRNVAFETRYADGKLDRLPALVAELVRANVDVVVTQGSEPVR